MTFIIPPTCPDRIVCQWHFEGGGYVALVSFGPQNTTEILDAIQQMIDLKNEEIASRSAPDFKATQNTAESDPSVRPDCSGADAATVETGKP